MSARSVLDPRRLTRAFVLVALCALAALSVPASSWASDANRASCPNEATTGFRPYLPDCRAYEMVSPPYKGGFTVQLEAPSADGSRVLAVSFGSFSDPRDTAPLGLQYEIARTPAGWQATPLDAPYSTFSIYTTVGITPDFRSALVFAGTPAQYFAEEAYLGPLGETGAAVGPLESPTAGGEALTAFGASQDLHRVLFFLHSPNSNSEEVTSLWPGDPTLSGGLPSLYEYEYTGATATEPRLVGISNSDVPANVGAGHLISDCGTTLGSLPEGDAYNAISASGGVAFFTAASCAGGPSVNEVFARLRQTPTAPAHTVAISEPTASDCEHCLQSTEHDAQFRGASLDGSKVIFMTEQRLLPQATGEGPYLYEYDFNAPAADKLTLISGMAPGPRVEGVARMSEDGSHVYFLAKGILAASNSEGRAPTEGSDNLYVSESRPGSSGPRVAFIATLTPSDASDWAGNDSRPVQATPNGRVLAFQSTSDLTSDEHPGANATQVFEYDASAETLVRVSRANGDGSEDDNGGVYGSSLPVQNYEREAPVGIGPVRKGLALSADGSQLFFVSRVALVSGAVSGAWNVYEYRNGQVQLISDGHDSAMTIGHPAVELLGTDESGHDVFFTTADRLIPQDTDDQVDIYDARVEGGFAPALAAPSCAGDSCQPLPVSSPQLPSPAPTAPDQPLAAASPAVQVIVKPPVKAKRCRRGLILKHHRCVRAKAKRTSRQRGGR